MVFLLGLTFLPTKFFFLNLFFHKNLAGHPTHDHCTAVNRDLCIDDNSHLKLNKTILIKDVLYFIIEKY